MYESPKPTRYEEVSRRSILRASLGAGAIALIPGLACGNDDAQVFAGATAEPVPATTTTTTTTTTAPEPVGEDSVDALEPAQGQAVAGEMVISFTYTEGATGKRESPYVAVWIEDSAGELAQTVSLWYQQGRRGDRWLDHLSRWYPADLDRLARDGLDAPATISSATRAAGAYAVVWDGAIDGTPAPAGNYFVCIESVREEGPYSLIREPLFLAGSIAETSLPDTGELSAASVRIDA